MCRGHLLDEDHGPLLGSKRGDEDGQEGMFIDAQLGAHSSPVPDGGIARHAVWNHADCVAAIAVPHEVLRLCSVDGDDCRRARPHRGQEQALMAPVRPQALGIWAQVLRDDVGSSVSQGDRMTDHVCADAARDDRG